MVVYRSAYQRFFKGPDWDDYSKEEYRSKAKYRSDRRSVEHQHHVWFWDSEIEEDDVEEIVDKERHVRDHAQVPTVREKEGGNRRSREAWSDKRGAQREKVVEERKQVDDKNQQQVREEEEDPKENSKKQQRHRQELGEKHRKSSEKRRKHRSSSESPSRNFKEKQRQPPFVAYGWANDGTVDKKRTHNILASSAEVCEKALCSQVTSSSWQHLQSKEFMPQTSTHPLPPGAFLISYAVA